MGLPLAELILNPIRLPTETPVVHPLVDPLLLLPAAEGGVPPPVILLPPTSTSNPTVWSEYAYHVGPIVHVNGDG